MRTLALLSLAIAAHAADLWRVVPAASRVEFTGSTSLGEFHGTAAVAAGALDLDPARPGGFVEVDARSMATGGEKRDQRMHSEVMQSAEHPRVRFDLRWIEPGTDRFVARGTWTMRGISREISMPVRLAIGAETHATATFSIDIRRWDIAPPRLLVVTVDPTVVVQVDLQLVRDAGAIAPRVDRGLPGAVANDATGTPVDLSAAVGGRVVVLYRPAAAAEAVAWCNGLERASVRWLAVRDDAAAGPGDPAGAVFDGRHEIVAHLRLPPCNVQALVFAPDGQLVDSLAGAAEPGVVARAVALVAVGGGMSAVSPPVEAVSAPLR